MSLRPRALPAVVAPCLPTNTSRPPSGDAWLHEIKHDGIRVIARKENKRVKLFSRPGNDLTKRFPLIVEGLACLHSRSCIIDGEAVACSDDGIALFERIRYRRFDSSVFLYAFDLIELNGDDLRREPLEWRKAALERLLARAGSGVQLNEQAILERCDPGLPFSTAFGKRHQHANASCILLRACCEWPRGSTAEQRDELSTPHSITSSASASKLGGISRPIALAVLRLTANSNLVGCWTGSSLGFSPRRMRST